MRIVQNQFFRIFFSVLSGLFVRYFLGFGWGLVAALIVVMFLNVLAGIDRAQW